MHPLCKFKFCPICGSSQFEENNPISKICHHCGFVYYSNPRAATVAFIRNEKGDLLVAKRAKEPAKGTLDLPGGFVDIQETGEEAISREVLEETGLTLLSIKYLFSLPNIYPYSGIIIDTLDQFFECTITPEADVKAMDDVEDLYWIPLSEIDPNQFGLDSIRRGIQRYIQNQ